MRRIAVPLIVISSLMAVWAAPTMAAPPERSDEPLFFIHPDLEHRVALFLNITRADFCAWQDDGFAGEPPVANLVPAHFNETGQGAIVGSGHAEVPIELWQLDADVPPLVDPCADTDDQAAPWATGTARIGLTDNDLDVSLTRLNSFGFRLHATVTDAAGADWRYSASGRSHITQAGEFILRSERSNLTKVGR